MQRSSFGTLLTAGILCGSANLGIACASLAGLSGGDASDAGVDHASGAGTRSDSGHDAGARDAASADAGASKVSSADTGAADTAQSTTRTDADAASPRDASRAEASCAPDLPAGKPCDTIPSFGNATQVLDGYPYEFCGTPYLVWSAATAKGIENPDAGFIITTQVSAYVAWSATAMHLYFEVVQPNFESEGAEGTTPYLEDAIEIFLSGTANLHGSNDPSVPDADTDALEIIAEPAATDGGAGGAAVWVTSHPLRSLTPGTEFATRRTSTGYAIELELDAETYFATTFSEGLRIGFDFGVDAYEPRLHDGGPDWFQGYYAIDAVDGGNTCSPHNPLRPFCDDRTWCKPTLQPF